MGKPSQLRRTDQNGEIKTGCADSDMTVVELQDAYVVNGKNWNGKVLREMERKKCEQNIFEMSLPNVQAEDGKESSRRRRL